MGEPPTSAQWELKAGGPDPDLRLCVLQVRLGLPAVQLCRDHARRDAAATERDDARKPKRHVLRTTRLFQSAGRHFNRGQRAFFFALGYLGWFAGPWPLFVSTTAMVIVMWRRQFASAAQRALTAESERPRKQRPKLFPVSR